MRKVHFSHPLHATFRARLKTPPPILALFTKIGLKGRRQGDSRSDRLSSTRHFGVCSTPRCPKPRFREISRVTQVFCVFGTKSRRISQVCTNFVHNFFTKSIHRPAYKIRSDLSSLMEKDPRGSGENRPLALFRPTSRTRAVSPRKKASRNSARDRHATTSHHPNTIVHRSHIKLTKIVPKPRTVRP